MRTLLLLLTTSCVFTLSVPAAQALPPVHNWSARFGSSQQDGPHAVAIDDAGNIYMVGYFGGAANFGGGPLVSAGGWDAFVAKYNSAGVHQWSKRLGGSSDDYGWSVAVDKLGNVIVAGFFQGTVDFGGGPLVSAGYQDYFLAKYDANGTHQWSKRFGGLTQDWYRVAVAVDDSGNVVFAGGFEGSMDFGGGLLGNAGYFDVFLAKYNANGTHLWSKRFGGPDADLATSVAVDALGEIVLTGEFYGAVDFGGDLLVSAGSYDAFLAKYDENGTHHWSKRLGGSDNEQGGAVTVDRLGNIVVTGVFKGTVNFGGGDLVSAGDYDLFCTRFDASGAHQWSKRIGGVLPEQDALAVAVDHFGDVIVTGNVQDTVGFNGGIIFVKYDVHGVQRWSQTFQSTGGTGRGVATDGEGNVTITGEFSGTTNLGGGPLVASGVTDIFLARFAADPNGPVITSITDIGNDQGRKVKIRFNRSAHDRSESSTPIMQYEAYRRDDPAPASSRGAEAGLLSARQLLADGWTQVGVVAAHEETSYGMDVPTIGDSTVSLGSYYSAFYVRASTAAPGAFYDSAADSGQSVDNLAPGVPGGLVYSSGVLSWNESAEEDLDYYTVYGSATGGFPSAVVVGYSIVPSMDAAGSQYVSYFVTATDFSGNEGKPATVNTVSGSDGTPRSYVLSVSNFPNPFNPGTVVSYTVPARGAVTVAIYDAHGLRVATLLENKVLDAGAYKTEWRGLSAAGAAVSSGVYFARIEQAGLIRTKKMVLLK